MNEHDHKKFLFVSPLKNFSLPCTYAQTNGYGRENLGMTDNRNKHQEIVSLLDRSESRGYLRTTLPLVFAGRKLTQGVA